MFYQSGPELKDNPFESDPLLQEFLKCNLPDEFQQEICSDLRRFGRRVISDIWKWAQEAENNPPHLQSYEPWGRRIDRICLSSGWENLHAVAAEEGLVAIGYGHDFGGASRLYQMAKLFLYHPSSAFYSCPLAMTDGAAKILQVKASDDLRQRILPRLVDRNPEQFWTSGQWMTERSGGSDVSGTETIAEVIDGQYTLVGDKFFTSATTSNVALTLARIRQAGQVSKDLSLFLIELRDSQGQLNNIEILRLKDKLGTRALPTAELRLMGTPATLVCGRGQGVKNIAPLLNMTRLYNTICALAGASRMLYWVRQYSHLRKAFGQSIARHPLHARSILSLESLYYSAFFLGFQIPLWLGREEAGKGDPSESQLCRLLTPVAKMYTGRVVMDICREGVELIGGAGYMEDTDFPRQLRDAQVFSIWEGTTNIMSLDMLRALDKDQSWTVFSHWVSEHREALQRIAPKFSYDSALGRIESILEGDKLVRNALARTIAQAIAVLSAVCLAAKYLDNGSLGPSNQRLLKAFIPEWVGWLESLSWNFEVSELEELSEAIGLANGHEA